MKIQKHTAETLELAGRREDKEQGVGGLWLVWLVGVALVCGGSVFFYSEVRAPSRGAWEMAGLCVSVVIGCFGLVILACGVYLLLRREYLNLDLKLRHGRYWTWSPWAGTQVVNEFTFEQVERVSVVPVVEVVSAGDELPGVYEKVEARLHVRPGVIIRLVRGKDQRAVKAIAAAIGNSLGAKLQDDSL